MTFRVGGRRTTKLRTGVLTMLLVTGCGSDRPAQNVQSDAESWLRKNVAPFRSLSISDSDFADLAPLGKAISDARVVLLGEETHGDGATFEAKARIIRYLHEVKGFDVLAWESGLFDMRLVWNALQRGEDPIVASRRGLFGIWSFSKQVTPLLQYVGSTRGTLHPLEMAGFDSQLTGMASTDSLVSELEAFAVKIGASAAISADWLTARRAIQQLTSSRTAPTATEQERTLAVLDALQRAAASHGSSDADAVFWTQMLLSLRVHAPWQWSQPATRRPSDNNSRDLQMAKNLIWLAQVRYPDKKIVGWAASSHIARDVSTMRAGISIPYAESGDAWGVHMGTEAFKVLGTSLYTIGFTAARGTWGSVRNPTPRTLAAPAVGSLEALLLRLDLRYAFFDMRAPTAGSDWLRQSTMRPFGYSSFTGDWPRSLDGMIYIRDMTPSIRVP